MTKLYVLDGPDRGKSFDLESDTIYIERSLRGYKGPCSKRLPN